MARIFSLVIATLTVIAIVILVAGYTSNPSYKDSVTVPLQYSPELVWQQLIDVKGAPLKKSDVASVEVVDQYGKLLAWRENLKGGGYRVYRMNEWVENRRLVIEMTESSYGLTGVWTFRLSHSPEGTDVQIGEESVLDDIKTRGIRYFLGRDHDLLAWSKYLRVGLTQQLLATP
jgi:hypothetical protein